MNLYEMSHDFEAELDAFDALINPEWERTPDGDYITEDGELITPAQYAEALENRFAALDAMEQDIEKKAENVAVYIKKLLSDAEQIKAEEKSLAARRKAKENTAASLKRYLMNCMTAVNRMKIDKPRAVISVRDNAESVEVSDPLKFIRWAQDNNHEDLLKYSEPEIRKSAIKPLLQNGENIPYTALTRTKSVIIK